MRSFVDFELPVAKRLISAALRIAGWLCFATGALAAPPERDVTGKVDDYNQWKQAIGAGEATEAGSIVVPKGFQVERLCSATKEEGSWISMAFDPQDRLVIGREGAGLLRLTLPKTGDDINKAGKPGEMRVETIDNTLKECRGLGGAPLAQLYDSYERQLDEREAAAASP